MGLLIEWPFLDRGTISLLFTTDRGKNMARPGEDTDREKERERMEIEEDQGDQVEDNRSIYI